MKTYTDDNRKFYTVRDSFWNETVTLTDTHTGFEVNISRAKFARDFREETEKSASQ